MSVSSTADEPRLTVEVAELWPSQGQWSESDYFNLPETPRIVELSEGELIVMPPPSSTHQRTVGNLYLMLRNHVEEHNLGIVIVAPLAVRLWPGKIREPDVLFYTSAHQDRIGELVSEPPDLAVEVISPGTRKIDRHEKFSEYAQAGIGEYWLVDPDDRTVEVYALEEGAYRPVPTPAPSAARSHLLPEFKFVVERLFS